MGKGFELPAEMAAAGAAMAPGVRCEALGNLGHIVLDRPRALNALDAAMRREIAKAFARWAKDPMIYCLLIEAGGGKAFCAGGDVREMMRLGREGTEAARANAADEYAANWRLQCFTKPHVALIDGIVIGSGAGLTQYGTHIVAGAGYAFSMPEVRIGFFPDCGTSCVLGKLPDGIGLYLALTGRSVGPGDAWRLGLVTHCIAREHFSAIRAALADAQPVDILLDRLHADPGAGEIEQLRPLIKACFVAESLGEILARLEAIGGGHADWAAGVVADIAKGSPTSLAVTFRLIRQGASMGLREALQLDLRLAVRFYASADFHAGTAALIEGRSGSSGWSPARIEDVDPREVERFFSPLGEGDLALAEPDPQPRALA